MAKVTVRRPTAPKRPLQQPHVVVVSSAGTVSLGAPNEVTDIEGLGSTWASIDRPGTNALLRRATRNRLTYKVHSLLIGGLGGKTVEQQILALDAICASRAAVGVSYGEMARHKWVLKEVTGQVTDRAEFTNAPTHAEVDLTFVVAVQEYLTATSRVTAARSNTPASNKPAPTAKAYTVRAGDTLSSIAARVYGNANRMDELARKNGIRNPNSIRVGQVLKL